MSGLMRWTFLALACCLPSAASADPLYLRAYTTTFPSATKATRCANCHAHQDKRQLNEYGSKLHESLEGRRTKDEGLLRRKLLELGPAH